MPSSDLKFEIGQVLLMDIVGYSALFIDQQAELMKKLSEIGRRASQFRLLRGRKRSLGCRLETGIALVFRNYAGVPAAPPANCIDSQDK
jgi:hypothetical protein